MHANGRETDMESGHWEEGEVTTVMVSTIRNAIFSTTDCSSLTVLEHTTCTHTYMHTHTSHVYTPSINQSMNQSTNQSHTHTHTHARTHTHMHTHTLSPLSLALCSLLKDGATVWATADSPLAGFVYQTFSETEWKPFTYCTFVRVVCDVMCGVWCVVCVVCVVCLCGAWCVLCVM